ncbi:MAG TPA: nucleotide exchange factor GrpE [Ktedonobacterales bacterium]
MSDEPITAPEADPAERISTLEAELAREREAASEYMRKWQLSQADFANFRRRTEQGGARQMRLEVARAMGPVLAALDTFERAFQTLPVTLRALSWIDGMSLIHMQLHAALEAAGIREMETLPGDAFDPARHESIGEVDAADVTPGHVAVVAQRGYLVEADVLRPALVQLARAAPAQAVKEDAVENS